MKTEKAQYFYGLDELRAGLMLIGVFWHAVSVISPHHSFVYPSAYHQSTGIYASIYPEHIFRMEAFFLVSGFLSRMVLTRRDKSQFFSARVKRVLLPLLLGCFGVNLLLQIFGAQFMPKFQWLRFDLWRLVMHGWFLITLFMCALVDMALPKDVVARTRALGWVFIVLLATVGYVAISYWRYDILAFFGAGSPAKSGLFSLNMFVSMPENLFNFLLLNTVQFWPFYFAGAALYHYREHLAWLPRHYAYYALALGVLAGIAEMLHSFQVVKVFYGPYQLGALWYRVNHVVAAGGIAFALFFYFFHSPRQGGRLVSYLINSAIVIYLVHHPLVIIFAWGYDRLFAGSISSLTYYALLVVTVLALSYLAYEGIRRQSWARMAFGLKEK